MGMFSGRTGAYIGVGMARGLQAALDDERARKLEARRQAIEDERLAQERDDRANASIDRTRRRAREDVTNSREDIRFDQDQEQYQHGMTRRPMLEQREDEFAGLRMQGAKQDLSKGEAELGMIPLRRRQIEAEIAGSGLRNAAAGLQLTRAKLEAAHDQAAQAWEGAVRTTVSSGDPTALQDWYNTHIPDGHSVRIEPAAKGGYDIHYLDDATGEEVPQARRHAGTLNEMVQLSYRALEPASFEKSALIGLQRQPTRDQRFTDEAGNVWMLDPYNDSAQPRPVVDPATGQQMKAQPRGQQPMFFPGAPAGGGMGGQAQAPAQTPQDYLSAALGR